MGHWNVRVINFVIQRRPCGVVTNIVIPLCPWSEGTEAQDENKKQLFHIECHYFINLIILLYKNAKIRIFCDSKISSRLFGVFLLWNSAAKLQTFFDTFPNYARLCAIMPNYARFSWIWDLLKQRITRIIFCTSRIIETIPLFHDARGIWYGSQPWLGCYVVFVSRCRQVSDFMNWELDGAGFFIFHSPFKKRLSHTYGMGISVLFAISQPYEWLATNVWCRWHLLY